MKVYRRTPRRREGCHHWIAQRGQDLPANIFDSGESGDLRGVYRRQGSGIARGNVNGVLDGSSDQRAKFGLAKYAVPFPIGHMIDDRYCRRRSRVVGRRVLKKKGAAGTGVGVFGS
jgi:hypothetical protein